MMSRLFRTFWPWVLVLLGLIAIVILLFVPFETVPLHLLLLVFAFFAIQFLAVLLHEFGHLLACVILGELPAMVQIGDGEVLAQIRMGPITIRLCATMNSGFVRSRHHLKNFNQADMFLLYAAGPVMDLLVVAGVLWFLKNTPENILALPQFDHQIKPLVIVTGAYIFYYQLSYLFRRSSYQPGQHTDAGGLATLWPILGASEAVRRAYVRLANHGEAERVVTAETAVAGKESATTEATSQEDCGSPPDETLAYDASQLDRPELLDLQAYYEFIVCSSKLSPDHSAYYKDAFITNVVLYNLTDQLPIADQYSAELVEKDPANITYLGSRGSVLIALGKIDSGKPLLEKVYRESETRIDRSISAAYLAIAEGRHGNRSAAEEWLARAVAANPDCAAVRLAKESLGG